MGGPSEDKKYPRHRSRPVQIVTAFVFAAVSAVLLSRADFDSKTADDLRDFITQKAHDVISPPLDDPPIIIDPSKRKPSPTRNYSDDECVAV